MIVAFFIIYQTMAISVDQRRRDTAIARALGFTRSSIVLMFLCEATILGALGSLGGICGGYLLARLSLRTALAGVSDMYAHVAVAELSIPPGEVAIAVALGVTTCLVASIGPAMRAAVGRPAEILRSTRGIHAAPLRGAALLIGLLITASSTFVLSTDLRLPTPASKATWIMLGHALLLVGASCFAPAFVTLIARALLLLGRRANLILALATEFFSRQPQRTAATASAIMVGYAEVVSRGG